MFSETAWPIKNKFDVKPSLEEGTEVCIKSLGHMTKMAAMLIYGENLKELFSRTKRPMILKPGMQYLEIKVYKSYINVDPEST